MEFNLDENSEQRVLLKDNILVKTKYELNLAENRLYNLLLYKFQKEGRSLICVITQDEVKEVVKFKGANTINGIKEILDKLSSKKVLIEEKKLNSKNSRWHNYNLIDGFTYDDEFNTFEVKATEKIYDLLKKKFENGGYTPSNLNIFLNLKNYYAQRLYDLLRLWSASKTVINYSVEDIKDYLMLNNQYPEYGNFKRRVIVPAVKELNSSGCFKIDIKEVKVGRKVESIDFIVEDLDKRIYFNKKESSQKIVELENKEYKLKKELSVSEALSNNFYIPNKKLFTSKTLNDFTKDFKNIDFKDNKTKNKFYEAIGTTLEKDDTEKIYVKSYKYFKKVLECKLEELNDHDNKLKKTKFHNFDETFTKYTEEEFEDIILKSQKKKFG